MAFLDIFKPKWKTDYEVLIAEHYDAVKNFVFNNYIVYPDMRSDDKARFKEYNNLFESQFKQLVQGVHNISELQNPAKKFIAEHASLVKAIYSASKRYSTKLKRVCDLAERYSRNYIFKETFRYYLGNEYSFEELSDEQLDYILEHWEMLVKNASDFQEDKKKKQSELKAKIVARATESAIAQLIRKQEGYNTPIEVGKQSPAVLNEIAKRAYQLKIDYKAYNVFELVAKHLLPVHNLSKFTPGEAVLLLASKQLFFVETEFVKLVVLHPTRKNHYKDFIMNLKLLNNDMDNFTAHKYCLDHIDELDSYVSSEEINSNIDVMLDFQKDMNEHIFTANKDSLYISKKRMYVGESLLKNGEKKIMPLLICCIKRYCQSTSYHTELSKFINNSEWAHKVINQAAVVNIPSQKTLANAVIDLFDFCDLETAVVWGNSEVDNPQINVSNLSYIKNRVETNKIKNYNETQISSIDEDTDLIIVVEVRTSVEKYKATCKQLSSLYPYANIAYFSVYLEMTNYEIKKAIS